MHIERAEKYISEKLRNELPLNLHYHDYEHTSGVVKAAIELAKLEEIDEDQLNLLITAAWYHDSGFLYQYENHEEKSCQIVNEILPSFNYTTEQIAAINTMIMKTKVPQLPVTLLECILCDADLYHLGSDEFENRSRKLYMEWSALGMVNGENEFNRKQIDFLQSHHYWTASAKSTRENQKAEHLKKLKMQLQF